MDVLVQEHLAELERRLALWKKQRELDFKEFVENLEKRDAVMHNMLVAIQSTIDLGNDIIRLKGFEMPSSYKDIFVILQAHRIIPEQLATELEKLAGFRNVLVHLYWKIDLRQVYQVFKTKASILEKFCNKAKAIVRQ